MYLEGSLIIHKARKSIFFMMLCVEYLQLYTFINLDITKQTVVNQNSITP